jgi:hypothetical protein
MRFWSKVDLAGASAGNPCWEWTAAKKRTGYGVIGDARRGRWLLTLAHRLSWELHFGPIPDGLCVLHRCDNPGCVNPNHLSLGTKRENTADMIHKGRARGGSSKGSDNGNSKLTEEQVVAMRIKRSSGASLSAVASEFGIARTYACAVCRRKHWRHIQ